MPQMNFADYSPQLVWLVLCFIILYFVISKFIIPRMESIIEKRANHISSNLDQAKEILEKAKSMENDYSKTITEAYLSAEQIIKKTSEEMRELSNKKLSELDKLIHKKVKNAEDEIKIEKQKTQSELKRIVEELTYASVNKLTGIAVDKSVSNDAVNKIMKDGK